ncbi:hypothetical protein [Streptomyces sp. URMC 125]|uniref:hypothetical protein n=1 Tax=Streptomyces sp. URMC 125 TaxID=3423419 RepID=UPI003F1CAF45
MVYGVRQQLGNGDSDGFDRPRHHGDRGFQLAGDLDAVVTADPGLRADNNIAKVRVGACQPRPRAAQHPGRLDTAQVLLVELVQLQQIPRDVRGVVSVLHFRDLGLQSVALSLDGGRRPPHHGLCGLVHALPLGGHGVGQMLQYSLVERPDLGSGEGGVQEAGDGDVPVCEMSGQGRQPSGDQVLCLLEQGLVLSVDSCLLPDGCIPLGP